MHRNVLCRHKSNYNILHIVLSTWIFPADWHRHLLFHLAVRRWLEFTLTSSGELRLLPAASLSHTPLLHHQVASGTTSSTDTPNPSLNPRLYRCTHPLTPATPLPTTHCLKSPHPCHRHETGQRQSFPPFPPKSSPNQHHHRRRHTIPGCPPPFPQLSTPDSSLGCLVWPAVTATRILTGDPQLLCLVM